MTYIIAYEVSVGENTYQDEVTCLATSEEQTHTKITAYLENLYGEDAVLLSLQIVR